MIAIYYIATGSYKVHINNFLDSLYKFREGLDKTVVLLTDSNESYSRDYLNIVHYRISDAPWPIVALLKMWYIHQFKIKCDEVYYFNSNLRCVRDINFIDNKLLLTRHTFSRDSEILDGHRFMNFYEDNPNSLSFIGKIDYTYVQSGFFGGNSELVYKMCEDISNWVENDLRNCIIPRWHDESYLNKWVLLNKHLCHINKYMGMENDNNYPLQLFKDSQFIPKRK